MRCLPALLVLALLLAPSALAQSGSAPRPGSVWTVHTSVEALVQENYATVKVIASIANRGPDPEFPFVVRIPDDAFVTGLTIERDGTVYEAKIKDREVARQEYEAWKAKEQTGGLVEKARHTSVYSYLINVAEFTNVRATLTYERYLAADRGVYNLSLEAPVSGFGQDLGADFTVDVRDTAGVAALWGEPAGQVLGSRVTYSVGPRAGVEHPTPFTASYMLSPTTDAGSLLTTLIDGKGYFAHRFRASEEARLLPMDLVLVLDVSGSMAGLKLQQMVDAAKQVVGSLHDADRLHIVAFSSDARSPWQGMREMTPENRKAAAREIDGLFDGGGTNIEAGLRRGLDALATLDWAKEEGRFPAVVLLTDGQPTLGQTTRDALLDIERAANTHKVPLFGIAFGDDADWGLIRALSQEAQGAALRVPVGQGAEVDLRRFMAALTTPVLRNVRIEYGPGVVAFHPDAPTLFAGSELLVVGTFDPARGIMGNVTGQSAEGPRTSTFASTDAAGASSALSFLPRLVAYHKVRALQEADAPDVAAIKELALSAGFVTDHTSLVLTLPAREWREGPNPGTTDDRCAGCEASSRSAAPTSTTMVPSGGAQGWPFAMESRSSADTTDAYQVDDASATPSVQPSDAARTPGIGVVALFILVVALAVALRRR